jgi:hypothetical protein
MRHLIRRSKYVMTAHAEEEMTDDDLSILDVVRLSLTGKLIIVTVYRA